MSLTLQEFKDNFEVTVVNFDDTNNNVNVHFKVQCNRLSIHTTSVDTTQLSQGYSNQDVVTAAGENVKTTVNSWASFNVVENRLTELTITSTSSAIDLSTFNENFIVKIIRFELVPDINPTNWCIGFSVAVKDNEAVSNNFEGLVPITQDYCNNTLCSNIANSSWELVKDKACQWASEKLPTHDVLDTKFIPTNI